MKLGFYPKMHLPSVNFVLLALVFSVTKIASNDALRVRRGTVDCENVLECISIIFTGMGFRYKEPF